MSDLTFISESSSIAAVDLYLESIAAPRLHLGLSEVGHKCQRYKWYKHHGYVGKQPEGRILRLFRSGNNIEFDIVTDLMSAGFSVHSSQKEVRFTYQDSELLGHIDGIVEGLLESPNTPHLLEIKSMSDKYFQKVKKVGYENFDQKYKGQVHEYMLGLNLKRAFVVCENKNTSERYAERIKINKEYAVTLLKDTFDAITRPEPPERACPRADWFEAKWCSYYGECFNV